MFENMLWIVVENGHTMMVDHGWHKNRTSQKFRNYLDSEDLAVCGTFPKSEWQDSPLRHTKFGIHNDKPPRISPHAMRLVRSRSQSTAGGRAITPYRPRISSAQLACVLPYIAERFIVDLPSPHGNAYCVLPFLEVLLITFVMAKRHNQPESP